MSKNIPNLNVNVDTFESWVFRINDVLETLRTEVLTANSSGGTTGSSLAPLSSVLFGSFTANTLAVPGTFSANSSQISVANASLRINGSIGTAGQVLTSNGTGISWSTPPASTGTVTQINTGAGLSGGPISTSGSIQVRANTGIIANTSGLFVDADYVRSVVSFNGDAASLQGRTWANPGAIGSTSANTGVFTTLTATGSIRFGNAALVTNSGILSPGIVEGITPPTSTTGGIRIRARQNNTLAYLQVTNNEGNAEWSHVAISPTLWNLTADLSIQGGIPVGYRNLPQIPINSSTTMQTTVWGGRHIYKTVTSAVDLGVPDNATDSAPIGTAITIVNDASSGNITFTQLGATILQLGGSITTGNRTIAAGGFATILKVQTNKWIVSGPGVS